MGSETKPQQFARESGDRAIQTTQQNLESILGSDLFASLSGLVQQIVDQPRSITDQERELIFQNAATQATGDANRLIDEVRARSTTGGGIRSGSTQRQQFEIGSQLADNLARADRESRILQQAQRIPDFLQAIQAAQIPLNIQSQLSGAVSNAQLGQGQIIASTADVPSPAAQIGAGIGSLFGSAGKIVGAGTTSSGVFPDKG